jgi:predicted acetyltransferase
VTDTYPIRAITRAEAVPFFAVMMEAFGEGEPAAEAAERELITLETDRTAAAFDGDTIVGTSAAYTFALSVPGGTVATAGITAVAVLPTYRRRGILSAMMRDLLADAVRRGEPLAALFASEAAIYRRFGFGCAAEHLRGTIRRGEGVLLPPALDVLAAGGAGSGPGRPRIRLAEPGEVLAEMAAVYAAAGSRPGAPARDDRWWQWRVIDPERWRGGATALRCVLAQDDGGPRGYALYTVKSNWSDQGLPAHDLSIRELIALDPAATAALWSDLLSRDLVGEVRLGSRPVDDPLLPMMADRRRVRATVTDNLWVRILDVAQALRERRYAGPADVVIEVTDDLLPANAGRWRLQVAADGKCGCEATTAPADVILPVSALGAAYLGGTRLGSLAAAGQAAEIRPGALAALSAALSWDPAPWCPMVF